MASEPGNSHPSGRNDHEFFAEITRIIRQCPVHITRRYVSCRSSISAWSIVIMSHNSAAQSAAAALESLNAADSGVSAAHGQPELADQPAAPWLKVEEGGLAAGTEPDALPGPRNIVFVAWRDLANPRAGGSEVLVDKLAAGMAGRGHQVSLLCGGPSAPR